ncbi:MAG: ABC transporter substrate-binding protein [Bdellovibrionales bacterium]|nr:ABC transporter substrate-binding protein [Ramlibacter sp.]
MKALPVLRRSLLVGLMLGLSGGAAFAQTKKVTISQAFQSMLYLPLYVGMANGSFTKQGLDVTKETAGAPSAALAAVISGSANFSLHGPEWTAIAASKGAPVQIVSNCVNGAAVWIATTPDFKFTSIKDLKGETIVTGQMPTTSTSLFMKLFKENGLDPEKDVKMVQVPLGTEIGAFMAGQGKVAVMYEPGLDQAVAKGMKVVLGFPKLYGPYAFSTITSRTDNDPDTVQRFVNGMESALRSIHSDPAGAVAVAKKEFPTLDPVVIEQAVKRMIDDKVYPLNSDITPAALKVSMDTQIALGNLAAQPVYEKFINTTYIKKAVAMK